MFFNNKVSRINKQAKLFFNDSVLEVVTYIKYLGCYLTPNYDEVCYLKVNSINISSIEINYSLINQHSINKWKLQSNRST